MKKFLIALIAAGALYAGKAEAAYSSAVNIGKINSWQVVGGNWANAYAGGFFFKGTSMPSGISLFVVSPSDTGLKNLMAFTMMAINHNWTVGLQWEKVHSGCSSNCEAWISDMHLIP